MDEKYFVPISNENLRNAWMGLTVEIIAYRISIS